jgi:two-component system, OmpR family, heavy metal sensor histidine kinase CusS
MTSLRWRLMVAIALVVSLAFLASGVMVMVMTKATLHAQLDEALANEARALSGLVEQDGEEIESELGDQHAAAADDQRRTWSDHYAELWDGEGDVLFRSPALAQQDLEAEHGPAAMSFSSVRLPDGRIGRQVTLRFVPRQDPEEVQHPPRGAVLAVARGTAEVDETLARITGVLLGAGAAGTSSCLVLLLWVVRYALAPVRELASAIAEIREGDLAVRLDRELAPRELRSVVDRLNDLLGRLDAAFTRERELTAEIAHELRTPLAGLRVTIEVAISRERGAKRYHAALISCLAICEQAERVVESMLTLARLDARSLSADAAEVELDELVREVLAPHTHRISQRSLTVEAELPAIVIRTDREKLRAVLGNLIDNAISYADERGTIWIAITRDTIRIANTGCTLGSAEIARVFERFWRGDAARSGGVHAGLGLALCKKLVELLDGGIAAENRGGHFVATVTLPLAAA